MKQQAYSALARLQSGGQAGVLRAILYVARLADRASKANEAWQRVIDLCEAGLSGSDVNDVHELACYVRELEEKDEAAKRAEKAANMLPRES